MTVPTVIARGVVARDAGRADICPECGEDATIGEACPCCRQHVAPYGRVGTLTVATSIAGRRQVVTVERSDQGGWTPIQRDNHTAVVRTSKVASHGRAGQGHGAD